eukprot:365656-Chlamydomonas_euryale.AAC.4
MGLKAVETCRTRSRRCVLRVFKRRTRVNRAADPPNPEPRCMHAYTCVQRRTCQGHDRRIVLSAERERPAPNSACVYNMVGSAPCNSDSQVYTCGASTLSPPLQRGHMHKDAHFPSANWYSHVCRLVAQGAKLHYWFGRLDATASHVVAKHMDAQTDPCTAATHWASSMPLVCNHPQPAPPARGLQAAARTVDGCGRHRPSSPCKRALQPGLGSAGWTASPFPPLQTMPCDLINGSLIE